MTIFLFHQYLHFSDSAYVYLDMFTHFPPLPYSYTLIAIFIHLPCKDCFYYYLERNDVVVLFGTLKVQSFVLTEVSDCGLLIVVTSSTFLKRKDMLKEKNS